MFKEILNYMKIIKKQSEDIKKEEAHGGSGSRKLYR